MKQKLLWFLFECPSCHKSLRLTLRRRQVKEVLKGKREACDIRIEGIE